MSGGATGGPASTTPDVLCLTGVAWPLVVDQNGGPGVHAADEPVEPDLEEPHGPVRMRSTVQLRLG